MRKACITGASSGIGMEFARQLSARGYSLVLVARNMDRLGKLAAELETQTELICCDLSDEEACRELAASLPAKNISLLVNNAGFGSVGPFDDSDSARELSMIDVNVRAVQILCRGILPDFIEKDHGYILNVASVAGLMAGGPFMATYYATKSYVVSLTSSISRELKASGSRVRISALCPGPVDTNFNDTAGVKFALPGITPKKCVSDCLAGMRKGRLIIVPGVGMRVGNTLYGLLPRKAQLFFTGKAQKRKIK